MKLKTGHRLFHSLFISSPVITVHELAHTSHYQQAGTSYWRNYVNHVIANWGYGDGSEPLAGYFDVREMCAGFTEAEIFSCLTSGIHSIPALRNELISRFPLKTNQINYYYAYYFQ